MSSATRPTGDPSDGQLGTGTSALASNAVAAAAPVTATTTAAEAAEAAEASAGGSPKPRKQMRHGKFWGGKGDRHGEAVLVLFSSRPGVWQPGQWYQNHANSDLTVRCDADGSLERIAFPFVRSRVRPPGPPLTGADHDAAAAHRAEAPRAAARQRASDASVPATLRRHEVLEFDTARYPFRELVEQMLLDDGKAPAFGDSDADLVTAALAAATSKHNHSHCNGAAEEAVVGDCDSGSGGNGDGSSGGDDCDSAAGRSVEAGHPDEAAGMRVGTAPERPAALAPLEAAKAELQAVGGLEYLHQMGFAQDALAAKRTAMERRGGKLDRSSSHFAPVFHARLSRGCPTKERFLRLYRRFVREFVEPRVMAAHQDNAAAAATTTEGAVPPATAVAAGTATTMPTTATQATSTASAAAAIPFGAEAATTPAAPPTARPVSEEAGQAAPGVSGAGAGAGGAQAQLAGRGDPLVGPSPWGGGMLYEQHPSFRVSLPFEKRTGIENHRDMDYGHPTAETNWWVPVTAVGGSNTLYLESAPGAGDFEPVTLRYGQVLRFWGNRCVHYTVANTSGRTRVSFDFRVLPANCWTQMLPNGTRALFKPGGYYANIRDCAADGSVPPSSRPKRSQRRRRGRS